MLQLLKAWLFARGAWLEITDPLGNDWEEARFRMYGEAIGE